MFVVITYDVSTQSKEGRSRLRKVAKQCVNYGVRVQNSVFECVVDAAKWREVKQILLDTIKEDEDSLRFYYLGNKHDTKIEHIGVKQAISVEKTLVF